MSRTFAAAAERAWPLAAQLLGWRPGDFWESTPAELAGALGLGGGAEPPDAAALAALRARFPDEE